jgi:hypothetical protein
LFNRHWKKRNERKPAALVSIDFLLVTPDDCSLVPCHLPRTPKACTVLAGDGNGTKPAARQAGYPARKPLMFGHQVFGNRLSDKHLQFIMISFSGALLPCLKKGLWRKPESESL